MQTPLSFVTNVRYYLYRIPRSQAARCLLSSRKLTVSCIPLHEECVLSFPFHLLSCVLISSLQSACGLFVLAVKWTSLFEFPPAPFASTTTVIKGESHLHWYLQPWNSYSWHFTFSFCFHYPYSFRRQCRSCATTQARATAITQITTSISTSWSSVNRYEMTKAL